MYVESVPMKDNGSLSPSSWLLMTRLCFYQTGSAWSVDQGTNKNHSPAYNFTPTVTKFCVMWEGLSLPHDTKFGNCRCKIVDSRAFPSWSLIHGLRWSGLINAEPGDARTFVLNAKFRFLSEEFYFSVTTVTVKQFWIICVNQTTSMTKIHNKVGTACLVLGFYGLTRKIWYLRITGLMWVRANCWTDSLYRGQYSGKGSDRNLAW